jgi:hypothetical protein
MAWHASPYDFDKFGEMKKTVGTGQGASSYGKGAAYVAESPSVSGPGRSEYMKEFAKHPAAVGERVGGFSMAQIQDDMTPNNWRGFSTANLPHPFNTLSNRAFELISGATYAHALHGGSGAKSLKEQVNLDADQMIAEPDDYTTHGEDAQFLIAAAKEAKAFIKKHHTSPKNSGPYSYQVAVHLTPETMLDWDNTLENHHEEAQKKLAPLQHMTEGTETLSDYDLSQMDEEDRKAYEEDKSSRGFTNPNRSGQDFYHDLMRHFDKGGVDIGIAASEALHKAGIHGIRYLDGSSRSIPYQLNYNGNEIGKYVDDLKKSETEEPDFEALNYIKGLFRASTQSGGVDLLKTLIKNDLERGWWKAKQLEPEVLTRAQDLLNNDRRKFSMSRPGATYNYVIFHPDFVEALSQYNIRGDKVKDFGPGVHLKSVEHDPFKDEGK